MLNLRLFAVEENNGVKQIDIKFSTFPAGERYVCLDMEDFKPEKQRTEFVICLLSASSVAVMDSLLVANAVRENSFVKVNITLDASYLPYSRQDRVCKAGESNSLKVFGKLIETQFDRVVTKDVHNRSAFEQAFSNFNGFALNYNVDFKNDNFIEAKTEKIKNIFFPNDGEKVVVVSPDKGAITRATSASQQLGLGDDIVVFDKVRNGSSVSTVIRNESIELLKSAKTVVVVDDICDGGRTFISLAEEMKAYNEKAKFVLIVSHGIFSAGLDCLYASYSEVFCLYNQYNLERLQKLKEGE